MATMREQLAIPILADQLSTPLQKFLGGFSTAMDNGTTSLQRFDQRLNTGIEKVITVGKALKTLSDATKSLIEHPLSKAKRAAPTPTSKKKSAKNAHAGSQREKTGKSSIDQTSRGVVSLTQLPQQRLDIDIHLSMLTVQVIEFGNALQKAGATAQQMLSGTYDVTANLVVAFKNLSDTSVLMRTHIHQALARTPDKTLTPLTDVRSSAVFATKIGLMLQSHVATSTSNALSRLKPTNSPLSQKMPPVQNSSGYQLLLAANLRKSLLPNKEIAQFEFLAKFVSGTQLQALRQLASPSSTPKGHKKIQIKPDSDKASKKSKASQDANNTAQGFRGELNIEKLQDFSAQLKVLKGAQGAFNLFAAVSDKAHGWDGSLKLTRGRLGETTASKKHRTDTKKRPHDASKLKPRSPHRSDTAAGSSSNALSSLLTGSLTAFDLKFQKKLGGKDLAFDLQALHIKPQATSAKDARGKHAAAAHGKRAQGTSDAEAGLNKTNRLSHSALNGMLNAAKRIGSSGGVDTASATGGHTIHFSPVINLCGDTTGANMHSQVQVAMQNAYAAFELNMTRFLRAQNRTAFK